MQNIYEWFAYNSMKANPHKFQLIVLENAGSITSKIGDINIKLVSSVTLLVITIDSKLNFKEHFSYIVKKANYNSHALRRLRKFLTLQKAKILARSMVESQLVYCPLIWLFCSKIDMQRIEKIQYKTLHVVYDTYMTSYDEILA